MFLQPLQLTSSGRPLHKNDEFDITIQNDIDIQFNDHINYFIASKSITLYITPLRICIIPSNNIDKSYYLPFNFLRSFQKSSAGFFSRAKIIIYYTSDILSGVKEIPNLNVTFKFPNSASYQATIDAIENSLKSKVFISIPSTPSFSSQSSQSTPIGLTPKANAIAPLSLSTLGIGSIMRDVHKKQLSEVSLVNNSFSDLEQLMRQAQDLVVLAKKQNEFWAAQNPSENDQSEFNDLLVSLGCDTSLAAPVSKGIENFHMQLAKQMHDVLKVSLSKQGGIISLTDIFCLMNHTRANDYLSPEDILCSAKLISKVKSSDGETFELVTFDDGTKVIRSSLVDPIKIGETIADNGPTTDLLAAKKLNVSVAIARSVLLRAERNGLLCRDETIEAVYYYKNNFFR